MYWSISNFSLQYQYIVKHRGEEKKEMCKLGDFVELNFSELK